MRALRIATLVGWGVIVLLFDLVPAAAQKRVALVIGNGKYEHVPRLSNPQNDAELIALTLKSLGFTDRPPSSGPGAMLVQRWPLR